MRVFRCSCGHRMRFGANRCGWCWAGTPFYNRRATWLTASTALGAGLLLPLL